MEEIYVNIEPRKPVRPNPSISQTVDPWKSERRYCGCAVLCLGLLSVSLLAGLICLCVIYTDSKEELSAMKANLTERLQASIVELSSVLAQRDQLNVSLSEMIEKLDKLKTLSKKPRKICPKGWRPFSSNCYHFSNQSDSWENGRQDCRKREADLVIIDNLEEQEFLYKNIEKCNWIGLSDRETEGTWQWIDGTPVTLTYWYKTQPDNGGGDPQWGEEDCVHIIPSVKMTENWNDLRCNTSLQWICEKGACNEL